RRRLAPPSRCQVKRCQETLSRASSLPSSKRHRAVILHQELRVPLHVDDLHDRNTLEVRVQDPPGRGSAASDVYGNSVIDHEVEEFLQGWLPVRLNMVCAAPASR